VKLRTPHAAIDAINAEAGDGAYILWVDDWLRQHTNIPETVKRDRYTHICFYFHKGGRSHYALHVARSDGTAGALVLRAEA
jgi:hypothetical protein